MSTWISEAGAFRRLFRRAGVLLAFAALSGCSGFGAGGLSFAPRAPQSALAANGAVKIQGPKGFCIVPGARKQTSDGDFLLLASCAAISGSARHPHPEIPALITVAVSASAWPMEFSGKELRGFFTSEAGRAALSRSGKPEDISILKMEERDGVFIMHLRDGSKASLPGTKSEYWRAMLDLHGRILTVSVIIPSDTAPGNRAERNLLLALVESLRAANPQGPSARPAIAGGDGTDKGPLRPRPGS